MSVNIDIEHVSKAYAPGKTILDDISLSIRKGELFFLLGSSGCGKSTMMRILAGLLKADSGKILFNGENVTGHPAEKRGTAMVFQNYALWPHLSVFENVAFGLRVRRVKSAEIRSKVAEVLETVRLGGIENRKIQSLSGGQQQRVALARALAVNPTVLLLDEPLSNLDARLRDEMRGEIRRICGEKQLTSIYVTHDRREALSMADRIAVMNNGKLCQVGTPEELYQHPVDDFTARFLGDANLIPGRVTDPAEGTLETPCGILHTHAKGLRQGDEMEFMIRPENLNFGEPAPGNDSISCTVREGAYLGERTEWTLLGSGIELTAYERFSCGREKGSQCVLNVSPSHVIPLRRAK